MSQEQDKIVEWARAEQSIYRFRGDGVRAVAALSGA
jgi:hypothetical protein